MDFPDAAEMHPHADAGERLHDAEIQFRGEMPLRRRRPGGVPYRRCRATGVLWGTASGNKGRAIGVGMLRRRLTSLLLRSPCSSSVASPYHQQQHRLLHPSHAEDL
ncbi:hypothetical protein ZWY2020_004628 [Hordeum vulgare]|nr:hypothetical protein ZWY2020_004628 [Hordeum vulgare]